MEIILTIFSLFIAVVFVIFFVRFAKAITRRSKVTFLKDRLLIEDVDFTNIIEDTTRIPDEMSFEEFEHSTMSNEITVRYDQIQCWAVSIASDIDGTTMNIRIITNFGQNYVVGFSRKGLRALRQFIPEKEKQTWQSKIMTSPWAVVVSLLLFILFVIAIVTSLLL